MKKFNTKESCEEFLSNFFDSENIAKKLNIEVAKKFSDLFESKEIETSSYGFGLLLKNYAIKNEELELLQSFKDGFLALLSTDFLSQSATISTIAGIAFSIFEIGLNLYNKGINLTNVQFSILSILKINSNRMSVEEIHKKLNKLPIKKLEHELNILKNTYSRDGTHIELVFKDHNNHWGVVDI